MVFMFGLLIMHASMPRPKLAATHSSHCFAAVFSAADGGAVCLVTALLEVVN